MRLLILFFSLCIAFALPQQCDKYYGGKTIDFWSSHECPITTALDLAIVIEECKYVLDKIRLISELTKRDLSDHFVHDAVYALSSYMDNIRTYDLKESLKDIVFLLVERYICYNEKPWYKFMNNDNYLYSRAETLVGDCEDELLLDYEKLIEKMLEFEDEKYNSESYIQKDKIIWLQKEYTAPPYKLKIWNMAIQRVLNRHNNIL